MKKKIVIGLVLIVSIGGFFAFSQYNKPHRNIAEEKVDFTISANDLFDEFDANEKEANAKYLDKVIEVTGNVMIVDNEKAWHVFTLEAENGMMGGVMCTMNGIEMDVKVDDEVTLKCKCTGFLDDVVLTKCTLLK